MTPFYVERAISRYCIVLREGKLSKCGECKIIELCVEDLIEMGYMP